MNKFLLLTFLFIFQTTSIFSQANIAEARTYAQGLGVTITGIVTNDDALGAIRYVQDETAGLPFYDPSIADLVSIGDEVTIVGEMGDFNGLTQIVNVVSYTINSSGNPLPAIQVITPNELNQDTEAELVQINNVTFPNDQGAFQFAGSSTYEFESGGQTSVIYVASGSPLVGFPIPEGEVSMVGIVSQFSGNVQLLPRTADDFEGKFIDNIEQTNITTTSFDLAWETNFVGSTAVRYGTDPSDLTNVIDNGGATDQHAISLTGLAPTTFYYVEFMTENATESATTTRVFSTESTSTGEMKIYFNRAVDNSYSTGVDAIYKPGSQILSEMIAHMDAAQNTIDVCVYNNNQLALTVALNAAMARGVVVRYIADNGTTNSAISGDVVDVEFPRVRINGDALMHNKFMVIDRDSEEDSWVMTGSMNWTNNNINDDFNNVLFIQDQALAKAYTIEFQEMWGGDGPLPSIFGVKAGAQKTDNTPHNFIIGGDLVESYFSPSDNATNAITESLLSADNDIEFAVLSFTMNGIRDALIDRYESGIDVRGLIENPNDQGGEYNILVAAGLNVRDHPEQYDIHHKYAVVDARDVSSDPRVVTGSHNWSAGAENSNDENTLIIHSPIVANIYLQEFEARFAGLLESVKGVKNIAGFDAQILPNPVQTDATILLDTKKSTDVVVTLWTIDGQQLQSRILRNVNGATTLEMNVANYPNGNYLLSFQVGEQITSKQLVIQH